MASRNRDPVVYLMASRRNGTIYVGATSDLAQRVWQHKNNEFGGFTARYQVHLLVYCEQHVTMIEAIMREKQIKAWDRSWKLELIEKDNPQWEDLAADWYG